MTAAVPEDVPADSASASDPAPDADPGPLTPAESATATITPDPGQLTDADEHTSAPDAVSEFSETLPPPAPIDAGECKLADCEALASAKARKGIGAFFHHGFSQKKHDKTLAQCMSAPDGRSRSALAPDIPRPARIASP